VGALGANWAIHSVRGERSFLLPSNLISVFVFNFLPVTDFPLVHT
jgi:hypothetical protein